MIKILCCKHLIDEFVQKGISFKLSCEFACDCQSHNEVVVKKCKKFAMETAKSDQVRDCPCNSKLICLQCARKLFMLNYRVYKVCVKTLPKDIEIEPIDEYVTNFDIKNTKFYFDKLKK